MIIGSFQFQNMAHINVIIRHEEYFFENVQINLVPSSVYVDIMLYYLYHPEALIVLNKQYCIQI